MLTFFNLPPLLQASSAGFLSALWSIVIPKIPGVGLLLSPFLLVPLFFISLSRGLRYGSQAGLISTLCIFLLASPLAGYVFLFIHFIPFIAISTLILQKKASTEWSNSLGMILSKITAVLLIIIVSSLIALNNKSIDWQHNILQHLDQIVAPSPSAKPLIEQTIGWLPSLLGLSMILSLTANAYVAHALLEKFHRNLRIFQRVDWYVPLYWDVIGVLGLMIWILGKFYGSPQTLIIAKTIISLSCIPLAFIGVRICYLRLSWLPGGRLWFRLLCVVSFLLVWPFIFIVLLAFIEPWYGLTQRFSKNQRDTHYNDD